MRKSQFIIPLRIDLIIHNSPVSCFHAVKRFYLSHLFVYALHCSLLFSHRVRRVVLSSFSSHMKLSIVSIQSVFCRLMQKMATSIFLIFSGHLILFRIKWDSYKMRLPCWAYIWYRMKFQWLSRMQRFTNIIWHNGKNLHILY